MFEGITKCKRKIEKKIVQVLIKKKQKKTKKPKKRSKELEIKRYQLKMLPPAVEIFGPAMNILLFAITKLQKQNCSCPMKPRFAPYHQNG